VSIHWTTTLKTAPATEPVSVLEFREHARIDNGDEDTYIARRIISARRTVERITQRQLITATWELVLDDFPKTGKTIWLPYPPLQSITSIKYFDTDGVEQTWSSAQYRVDTDSEPGRISEGYSYTWPSTRDMTGAITIEYKAGYGNAASDVDEELRHAIELLTSHAYETREPILTGLSLTKVPFSIESLLWHHRIVRFDSPCGNGDE